MKDLLLRQWQAPGDLVVMTVALRDLHLTYPGMFRTQMNTCYPEVFYKNPYCNKVNSDARGVDVWYKKWKDAYMETGHHFTDAFIADLDEQLGLHIRKTSIWPEIYLTDDEMDPKYIEKFGIEKPYWLINAGIKIDIPLKQYPPFYWQSVIYNLNRERNKFGIPLVQVGHSHDLQPEFDGVKSLVGKTNNLRDYFALMYHSSGSMGHVSLQMHVAAAFRKPCVIVAGGREGWRWESYPGQQYLNVTGLLPCAGLNGCWFSKPDECVNMGHGIPKCYRMIPPRVVTRAVLKYHCK
jgi:ADP-heptose:LPS heptosyltransferase